MTSYFRRCGQAVRLLTKRRHGLFFLLLAAAWLLSGCSRRQTSSVSIIAKEISPQPPQIGPNTVALRLMDGSKPVAGAHVGLEGDMAHAGMAPVFGEAQEIAPGQYQGQLVFDMGGDWVVLMHITLPDGRKVEEQMAASGVKSK